MSANTPAPNSSTKQGPLSSFTRISELVYLYRPSNGQKPSANSGSSASTSASTKSPKLIIVASWMDAREPHIAKYTTRLQALYPDSPIVLIRSFTQQVTIKARSHPRQIEPAVSIIRSVVAEAEGGGRRRGGGGEVPDILLHVFSNGGSTTLKHLYGLYADSARPGEAAGLPTHVTIFDSAPGRWHWGRTVAAFTASLAGTSWALRLVMRPLLHLMCAVYWILYVPWGRSGAMEQSWLVHNDRAKNLFECRRTYIYSEEDDLIAYRDIEDHAAAADEAGYVSRLEKFSGSQHVAHVRVDEQRYWNVVRDTWEAKTTRAI
ncbi:hypothetical protein SLS53_007652 [Cytospora paraplurivora]|uniref:Indole-diterpene biosynthesis protein PaxU n=1 Tax=Cytospora paraplurivora TaxID=2898453 RepID=A0AAN9YDT4_9PEZI